MDGADEGANVATASTAAAPAPRPSRREELRDAARYAGIVFLSMRGALTVLALVAVALIPRSDGAAVDPGWYNVLDAWRRWDADWFLRIAQEGYQETNGTAAFFPLYPLLVRGGANLVGGHHSVVALALSNFFAYLALVAMYLLTRFEFGIPTARRATLYLAIFPTAFFLIAPYSESLFLFAAIAAMLAARRGRWGAAALAGAAASATRSIGLVIAPVLAVEALLQHVERARRGQARLRTLLWSLVCSLGAAGGTFAYLLFWRIQADDWLLPVRSQSGWAREYAFLPEAIWEGTRTAFQFIGAYSGGYHQLDWLIVILAAACAVWVVLKARLSYVVYTLLSLLVPLVLIFPGRPFMSMPRFILVIFPVYWAVVRFSERFRAHTFVTAVFAGALGVLTLLYVGSYFIF